MIKLPVREWSLSLPTSQPDIGTGATRLRHLLGMYYYGHCTLAAPAGVTAAARGWGRLSAVTSSSYQWNEAEPGEEKNILAHMVRSGVANRWRRPRPPSGRRQGRQEQSARISTAWDVMFPPRQYPNGKRRWKGGYIGDIRMQHGDPGRGLQHQQKQHLHQH